MDRHHATHHAAALGLLAFALLTSATAYAQPADKVQQLVNDARLARDAGKPEDAVQLLLEAYALRPDPALRFNIAKVYDGLGDCTRALQYYLLAAEAASQGDILRPEVDAAVRQELRAFACVDQPDLTIQLLEGAQRTFPDPGLRLNLALNYQNQQQCTKARATLDDLAQNAPADHPARQEAQRALDDFRCVQQADIVPPLDTEPNTSSQLNSPSWLAWSLLGLGALGWTTLAVNEFNQLRTRSDLDVLYGQANALPKDSPQYAATRDAYERLQQTYEDDQLYSLLGLSVGALGSAAGLVVWLLDLPTPHHATHNATLTPWTPDPHTRGATLLLSFD